ncbi:Acyl-CoA N-acyltransferase [Lasiodiplodia theobromae]|uniref:Acyl-CoA N-acyltransferase n=1 Tax=Lasiodiplodia theobromae TaxID=45133 RepID=A0A8H7IR21_9PEZI|nr:Acyl-CoA N-acyltransferase [Lasiodiplodia theobromae]
MTDPTFRITTPRLYLTHLLPTNPAHCAFIVTLYNTPEFIASIGGKPTSITTPDAARKMIENRFVAEHARNGYGTYLVSLKPPGATETPGEDDFANSTPIGTVSLSRGAPPDAYTAPDLGFAILPAHMRKGYAREAAAALLAWAERERGVDAVLGLFDPQNEASKGVFRSLGFEDRGTRTLRVFGGVEGAVWTKKGMEGDLGVYGL